MNKSVSVIIKALNEEAKIAATIESALAAVAALNGEVILADSLSTDRTVEIAQRYPIKIAQLTRAEDRSCGVGAQLGYQYAEGEYLYVLDGDMQMRQGFLEKAIELMSKEPDIAGVGGRLVERNTDSLEFQARLARAPVNMQPGPVDRLDGGGLYRRSAIEQVGYLTNRNLHSYEELDLAIRLRSAGYKLVRIPVDAVDHFGHTIDAFALLKRRWRSRYIFGIGEIVRASLGKPHQKLLLKDLRELRVYLIATCWILTTLLLSLMATMGSLHWWGPLCLAVTPLILMSTKRRSFRLGIYAITSWVVHAAALFRGLWSQQLPPSTPIPSVLRVQNSATHTALDPHVRR